MTTVRELIMSLLMNCNLDDKVEVEVKLPNGSKNSCGDDCYNFVSLTPRRVYHLMDHGALIECHDD